MWYVGNMILEVEIAAAKAARASALAPVNPSPEAQSKARTQKDQRRRWRYQLPVAHEPPGTMGKYKLVWTDKPENMTRLVAETLSPKQKKHSGCTAKVNDNLAGSAAGHRNTRTNKRLLGPPAG